jgi:hypothetical protein
VSTDKTFLLYLMICVAAMSSTAPTIRSELAGVLLPHRPEPLPQIASDSESVPRLQTDLFGRGSIVSTRGEHVLYLYLTVILLSQSHALYSPRNQFTTADAGYTTTDYVLKQLLGRRDCKWLTTTNADNAYGSDVIHRVRHASTDLIPGKNPDMLLLPIDSRNWAEQGKQL